ncbi:MAG TPA: EF-P beta-lysylation protein EpmB, partial [Thermoanaerobaculia bacterium]|nr:EF-P beta-lysylation protein EpmB [Thermoanaerobaculia bacterium]
GARAAAADFPLRVPRGFVARMRPGDPRDPLLLQVLAAAAEVEPVPGYGPDPLAEAGAQPVPGVLHKYRGRALLVVTGACAVHCRYCFRRHFPYGERGLTRSAEARALAWLAGEPSIDEAILSGGDPLTLPDDRLAGLAARLAEVPHLRRLRLHTRLPIVLPERVDEALLAWLTGTRLAPVVVVHANHAREIDGAVAAALGRLRAAGVPVLNQSVLLAGVNDSADALAELSEALFAAGALPYYLHLLDPVAGAAHFAVPEERARAVHAALAARLPGYLVPRLVREVPGAPGKVPVAAPDGSAPDGA